MSTIANDFIEFALEINALKFGSFTLKSGRQSPYFFNAGEFNTGHALAKLGEYYAKTITKHQVNFDMLFGPAYKGIPLVSSTAINLSTHCQRDVPYCFNRKEAKDHGEKGILVGHPLQGKVLLVDDVMTAGTAYRESLTIIEQTDANLSGVIVALDRQERGLGDYSALDEIRMQKNIPVLSICTLEDLINYLSKDAVLSQHVEAMKAYQQAVAPRKL